MRPTIEEFENREALTEAALQACVGALEGAVASRGRAFCALSGGSTPVPLYEAMSRASLPWEKVCVTLADERLAPEGSGGRNDELLDRHLLKDRAAAAHLVPLAREGSLPEIQFPLDLAVLGMGTDGHTASLFPEGAGLDAALHGEPHQVFEVTPKALPKDAPWSRLTLTPKALAHAGTVLLLVTGQEKRRVLEEALAGDDARTMPVRAILHAEEAPLRVLYAD